MRKHPIDVLKRLQEKTDQRHSIVISAITYSEMLFGSIGKKSNPKHKELVENFLECVDEILPWDDKAVEATVVVKKYLSDIGTPIGNNDTAIAGHAIATSSVLVTHNTREFERVPNLSYEDWHR
jgi:tRNA(fMet)-specific endonuclease VapC